MNNDLTYQDYIERINIQEVLARAGYTLNRRDGLRYPSYVRLDNNGQRIHGDKFIVSNQGKTCFRPPEQKSYNVIGFIKSFPGLFPEFSNAKNLDHLVNEVCRNILNIPKDYRAVKIIEPRKDAPAFKIDDYSLQRMDRDDFDSIRKFYPYFRTRGIGIDTQKAFADNLLLASKINSTTNKTYVNLSFPLQVPGKSDIVGFEERGRPRLDGSSGYKGKAAGSNSSEGLWIANLGKHNLSEIKNVLWFESGYDAMAYYQLYAKDNPDLKDSVFVSTGGNPTIKQFRGMLENTPNATHYACFDDDIAGRQFAQNLNDEVKLHSSKSQSSSTYVRVVPEKGKDWNELLLEKEELSSDEQSPNEHLGIDMDGDGDIELSESDERKQPIKAKR